MNADDRKKKYKTKIESVQLGKPPTEPRVLRKICMVVLGGGGAEQRTIPELLRGGQSFLFIFGGGMSKLTKMSKR